MQCHHREIAYTLRNNLFTGKDLFSAIEVVELIQMIFLFNYGIWWAQPEDIGFALGIFVKQIFGLELEDYSDSDVDWVCPTE